MEIQAYLTLPNGVKAQGLPMIVLPHGGPHGPRDMWGYNPEVQFFANRGIAVLRLISEARVVLGRSLRSRDIENGVGEFKKISLMPRSS